MLAYILHKHFLHKKTFQVFSPSFKKRFGFFFGLCILASPEMQDLSTLTSDNFFGLFICVFFCLPVFWAWTLCRGAVIRNTDVVTIKNDNSDPFTVTIVIWRNFFHSFFLKDQKESTMIIVCRKAGNCPRSKIVAVKYYSR